VVVQLTIHIKVTLALLAYTILLWTHRQSCLLKILTAGLRSPTKSQPQLATQEPVAMEVAMTEATVAMEDTVEVTMLVVTLAPVIEELYQGLLEEMQTMTDLPIDPMASITYSCD
jgi:hypothetical protein